MFYYSLFLSYYSSFVLKSIPKNNNFYGVMYDQYVMYIFLLANVKTNTCISFPRFGLFFQLSVGLVHKEIACFSWSNIAVKRCFAYSLGHETQIPAEIKISQRYVQEKKNADHNIKVHQRLDIRERGGNTRLVSQNLIENCMRLPFAFSVAWVQACACSLRESPSIFASFFSFLF